MESHTITEAACCHRACRGLFPGFYMGASYPATAKKGYGPFPAPIHLHLFEIPGGMAQPDRGLCSSSQA